MSWFRQNPQRIAKSCIAAIEQMDDVAKTAILDMILIKLMVKLFIRVYRMILVSWITRQSMKADIPNTTMKLRFHGEWQRCFDKSIGDTVMVEAG